MKGRPEISPYDGMEFAMIFQNIPVLDGNEKKYVVDCLDTNWISSMGSYIGAFEQAFARYCGCAHGAACSNGTAAIHLALEALGIGFGDEVIVPDYTLVADSNMVILAGAKPVFIDVDKDTWCIDPDAVEKAITPKTKAIIAVHMYGHPCDMDRLMDIAKRHSLLLVEDAAQAHGTEYKGRKAGSFGHAACFSFYATKTLTTGEGGLVLTNDPDVAERLRIMRSHGFEGEGRTYVHRVMGFNYRLTNLQAAIGLAQTERIDDKVAKKRDIAARYRERFDGCSDITMQAEMPWAVSSYWNFMIVLEEGFAATRDQVIARLAEKKIQCRLPFNSLHRQPVYTKGNDPRYPDTSGEFPVTDKLSLKGISLPSGLSLTDREIDTVAEAVLEMRR